MPVSYFIAPDRYLTGVPCKTPWLNCSNMFGGTKGIKTEMKMKMKMTTMTMNLVSNLFINPDDGDWIDGGNQDGGETDAAALAVDVQHVRVALRSPNHCKPTLKLKILSQRKILQRLQRLQSILRTHLCGPVELPHKLDVEPLTHFKASCVVGFVTFIKLYFYIFLYFVSSPTSL